MLAVREDVSKCGQSKAVPFPMSKKFKKPPSKDYLRIDRLNTMKS